MSKVVLCYATNTTATAVRAASVVKAFVSICQKTNIDNDVDDDNDNDDGQRHCIANRAVGF